MVRNVGRLTLENRHGLLERGRFQVRFEEVLHVHELEHEGDDGGHAVLRLLHAINCVSHSVTIFRNGLDVQEHLLLLILLVVDEAAHFSMQCLHES